MTKRSLWRKIGGWRGSRKSTVFGPAVNLSSRNIHLVETRWTRYFPRTSVGHNTVLKIAARNSAYMIYLTDLVCSSAQFASLASLRFSKKNSVLAPAKSSAEPTPTFCSRLSCISDQYICQYSTHGERSVVHFDPDCAACQDACRERRRLDEHRR